MSQVATPDAQVPKLLISHCCAPQRTGFSQVSAALRVLEHLDTVVPDYVSRFTGPLVKLFVVIQHDHKQSGLALAPVAGCVTCC